MKTMRYNLLKIDESFTYDELLNAFEELHDEF